MLHNALAYDVIAAAAMANAAAPGANPAVAVATVKDAALAKETALKKADILNRFQTEETKSLFTRFRTNSVYSAGPFDTSKGHVQLPNPWSLTNATTVAVRSHERDVDDPTYQCYHCGESNPNREFEDMEMLAWATGMLADDTFSWYLPNDQSPAMDMWFSTRVMLCSPCHAEYQASRNETHRKRALRAIAKCSQALLAGIIRKCQKAKTGPLKLIPTAHSDLLRSELVKQTRLPPEVVELARAYAFRKERIWFQQPYRGVAPDEEYLFQKSVDNDDDGDLVAVGCSTEGCGRFAASYYSPRPNTHSVVVDEYASIVFASLFETQTCESHHVNGKTPSYIDSVRFAMITAMLIRRSINDSLANDMDFDRLIARELLDYFCGVRFAHTVRFVDGKQLSRRDLLHHTMRRIADETSVAAVPVRVVGGKSKPSGVQCSDEPAAKRLKVSSSDVPASAAATASASAMHD